MPSASDIEIVATLRAMSADSTRLFESAAFALEHAEAIERVRAAVAHNQTKAK
ncbi:MAG: hypothetical protein U0169_02060 [Polyangiaceae bacterium]